MGKFGDLPHGGVNIRRIGIRHGLHDDGCRAADDDITDSNRNGVAGFYRGARADMGKGLVKGCL